MGRTALVVGATGLIGGHVLRRLATDDRWDKVVVLVRRELSGPDAGAKKIDARVVDFEALGERDVPEVDDVFACLGTTIKVAGSQEKFRRVDHGYTVDVARLARGRGATRLALVSSVGASSSSSTFYLRVKGDTERDVSALEYGTVIIARPSILMGERREERFGERVGIAVSKVFSPLLLGGLRVYRPIEGRDVAHAIVDAVASGTRGRRILTYDELRA